MKPQEPESEEHCFLLMKSMSNVRDQRQEQSGAERMFNEWQRIEA